MMAGIGLASAPLVWGFLHEYQRNRIRVFLNPGLEPYGSGYHVIQSMIAIGSGLFTGKGLFAGTQSQLNFLPENHTDFIFAVAGEEFGFIGVTIILLLYLIIIYRGITIAMNATDNFGTLLAVGIVSMFTFHVLVNVGNDQWYHAGNRCAVAFSQLWCKLAYHQYADGGVTIRH